MQRCADCQAVMLDRLYGLLDAAEAAAVDAHTAGCAGCAAVRAEAVRAQGLFGRAAKLTGPRIEFVPPPPDASPPPVPSKRLDDAAAATTDEPASPNTVRRAWVGWAVAAGLLLAVSGLVVPTATDTAGYVLNRRAVDREVAAYDAAVAERGKAAKELDDAKTRTLARVERAKADHDRLAEEWVKAEAAAIKGAAERPFVLEVRGPAAAIPGAPNKYTVAATDRDQKPKRVAVTAAVRGADGKAAFEATLPEAESATVELPADLWTKLPAGGDAFLSVSAKAADGTTVALSEPVRLLAPVLTTHLATDKPLYRPGETVYYRSLTLDRTRFQPPARDVNLRFELVDPAGKAVLSNVGLAKPAGPGPQNGPVPLVRGPDGNPVRGVGCGAFALPPDLPGGVYQLRVFEVPVNGYLPPPNARPVASLKLIVAKYTPDRLEKTLEFDGATYSPGEVVQAKLTVATQRKPVANARVEVAVKADGKPVKPDVASDRTDAAGAAVLRFTLPKAEELTDATVTVTVTSGAITETIVRPVPLLSRKVSIDFFPEGGDLVAGLPNRVYFRATTPTGKPADVSGVLTDGKRDVCKVATERDAENPGVNQGLGAFTFTPEPGKRYAVKLDTPKGVIHPEVEPLPGVRGYLLPDAKAEGVTLTVPAGVTKPGEPIAVQLGYAGKRPMAVLVGAYVRGRAVAHATATLQPGKGTTVTLDPGQAPVGGVTRITVFEEPPAGGVVRERLRPVAERLVFRRSGEALKLGFSSKAGVFHPGDPVTLDLTATTEAGRPTGAILYAAVTNRSTRVMADDKALQSLPTHFLLGGEVRTAADLEHADFLLTDHPRAAAGLDLLLGTQGWRRFAEQNPEQFRVRARPADADALFASLGSGLPGEWRTDVVKVSERYWPRYEAAAAAWDAAVEAAKDGPASGWNDAQVDLYGAEIAVAAQFNRFTEKARPLAAADDGMRSRRALLPLTVLVLFGLATLCGLGLSSGWGQRGVRRPLLAGAVGFGLIGLFVLTATISTSESNARWQQLYASVPKAKHDRWGNSIPVPTPAPAAPQGPAVAPERDVIRNQAQPPRPPRVDATGGPVPDVPAELLAPRPGPVEPPAKVAPFVPGNPYKSRLLAYLGNIPADEQKNIPNFAEAFTDIRQLAPNTRPLVVREYAHTRPDATGGVRQDFTETLYWHPVLILPSGGKGSIQFDLSDAVGGYDVTLAGHTLDGRLGAVTGTITVQKPLAVDVKLPAEIGSADALDLPVVVTNNTSGGRSAGVRLALNGFTAGSDEALEVEAPAEGSGRKLVRMTPARSEGQLSVNARADGGPGVTDAVRRSTTVVPDGFPVTGSASDSVSKELRATVRMPADRVRGTTAVTVTLFPNTLADLRGGLDGLLREPHGCFEQSSTANYPNVLALNYLSETGKADPDVSRRSKTLLDTGYHKLTGYECPDTPSGGKHGYEWFGRADHPHEALTAYGLLQFTDMAAVYPVDPEMLRRTKAFLLSRRDGAGGFARNKAALDRFGRAPQYVTDAYIAWAITEAERNEPEKSDLDRELAALLAARTGDAGKDPYFLSLLGNALLNRGRKDDAEAVLKPVAGMQAKDGSVPGATTSITASAGRDLVIETTALAVLGWLKAGRPEVFAGPAQSGIRWVIAQRGPSGTFGSSQSTILALKALVAHAHANKRPPESGELTVFVGDKKVDAKPFDTAGGEPVVIALPNPDRLFPAGETAVRVELSASQSYPVTVAWSARTTKPTDDPNRGVKLTASLDRAEAVEGESVRLTVGVENVTDAPHGMVVAVVGLPAGLRLPEDAKQLKSLTDGTEPKLGYWEVRGRELVLYWRGLAPKQTRSVAVELIADLPGDFRGPASRAYPYYNADAKHWVEPLAVRVKPRESK